MYAESVLSRQRAGAGVLAQRSEDNVSKQSVCWYWGGETIRGVAFRSEEDPLDADELLGHWQEGQGGHREDDRVL